MEESRSEHLQHDLRETSSFSSSFLERIIICLNVGRPGVSVGVVVVFFRFNQTAFVFKTAHQILTGRGKNKEKVRLPKLNYLREKKGRGLDLEDPKDVAVHWHRTFMF